MKTGGANDRRLALYCIIVRDSTQPYPFLRINWIGTAVNQFYAAVRKALIVVLVLRAIGILVGLGFGTWWLLS